MDEEQERSPQRYDVHLYAVVRVRLCGIRAYSHQEAIEQARGREDLHRLFTILDGILPVETEVEYAEEVDGFLVDEEGDEEHERSRYYCRHGAPVPMGTGVCLCQQGETHRYPPW